MTIERRTRVDVRPASLPPIGLSRVEAAAFVGMSPSFFDEQVDKGLMPRPRGVGRRLIWSRPELEQAFADLPYAEAIDSRHTPPSLGHAPDPWGNLKV